MRAGGVQQGHRIANLYHPQPAHLPRQYVQPGPNSPSFPCGKQALLLESLKTFSAHAYNNQVNRLLLLCPSHMRDPWFLAGLAWQQHFQLSICLDEYRAQLLHFPLEGQKRPIP